MIRKEFIDIVTNTGMATLKELRRLSMGKEDEINEFELLAMPYFDENKFAKVCSERYSLTFIDLRNASGASSGKTIDGRPRSAGPRFSVFPSRRLC
jgi:hypothetical protein